MRSVRSWDLHAALSYSVYTAHSDSTTEPISQFGGGIEICIMPHIGWINDFSWSMVNVPDNDVGMVRSGINFAL